jgi:hypothetical protein
MGAMDMYEGKKKLWDGRGPCQSVNLLVLGTAKMPGDRDAEEAAHNGATGNTICRSMVGQTCSLEERLVARVAGQPSKDIGLLLIFLYL